MSMEPVISLRRAAWILAQGDPDAAPDCEALLIHAVESGALMAVRKRVSHGGVPGGVSYVLPPLDWRIPRAAFYAWCARSGMLAPDATGSVTPPVQEEPPRPSRQDERIQQILVRMRLRDCPPLKVPTGEKARLRTECVQADPRLFTPAAFDHAWKAAVSAGRIRTENHEMYARGE